MDNTNLQQELWDDIEISAVIFGHHVGAIGRRCYTLQNERKKR